MEFQDKMKVTINSLLETKPFYAHFFLNCKISYDKKEVPTAAATVTKTGPELIFNTEYMKDMTIEEIEGIIEHEVLHLLFEHVFEMGKEGYVPRLQNVAMDCSINQYIKVLPKGGIDLKELNKMFKLNMLPEQNWEYYYAELKTNTPELELMSFDLHIGVGDIHEMMEKGMSKDEIKAHIKQVIDQAIKNCKGNVPNEIIKIIDKFNQVAKVSWKQVLSNFVARCTSTTKRNTRSKINRRFDLDQPGVKKKRELTLAVCRDSSGSISDEQYQQFHAEIIRIAKSVSKIYLIDADCVVQNVQQLKKNAVPESKRFGCGGTAYQPAITKSKECGCDAIIYFGDMDAADVPENPNVPFLWVITGKQDPPASFGSVIRLD